jgi:iron complex outermembrane receptor protein
MYRRPPKGVTTTGLCTLELECDLQPRLLRRPAALQPPRQSLQEHAGNQPSNTYVVTSLLAAKYTYPLGPGKKPPAVFVRGEWRYLGRSYVDYYSQDGQPGYVLFNARAGVSSQHLELAFWVRNVLERKHLAYGSLSPQLPTYMQSLPRLLDTTFTAKFLPRRLGSVA